MELPQEIFHQNSGKSIPKQVQQYLSELSWIQEAIYGVLFPHHLAA